jgi:hypothetical protein
MPYWLVQGLDLRSNSNAGTAENYKAAQRCGKMAYEMAVNHFESVGGYDLVYFTWYYAIRPLHYNRNQKNSDFGGTGLHLYEGKIDYDPDMNTDEPESFGGDQRVHKAEKTIFVCSFKLEDWSTEAILPIRLPLVSKQLKLIVSPSDNVYEECKSLAKETYGELADNERYKLSYFVDDSKLGFDSSGVSYWINGKWRGFFTSDDQ